MDDIAAVVVEGKVPKDDAYSLLMKSHAEPESAVLAKLRKAGASAAAAPEANLIYNRSLLDVLQQFTATLRLMFDELVGQDMYLHPVRVFWSGDRKIHTGILLLLIAFLLFFLSASS